MKEILFKTIPAGRCRRTKRPFILHPLGNRRRQVLGGWERPGGEAVGQPGDILVPKSVKLGGTGLAMSPAAHTGREEPGQPHAGNRQSEPGGPRPTGRTPGSLWEQENGARSSRAALTCGPRPGPDSDKPTTRIKSSSRWGDVRYVSSFNIHGFWWWCQCDNGAVILF